MIRAEDIKCICCGKQLEALHEDENYKGRCHCCGGDKESGPETIMLSGSMINTAAAGYGSCHDTTKFLIGVCDGCITKALEDGRLVHTGHYM